MFQQCCNTFCLPQPLAPQQMCIWQTCMCMELTFSKLHSFECGGPQQQGWIVNPPWTILAYPKGPPSSPCILDPPCLWEHHVLTKAWHFLRKGNPENRRSVLAIWSNAGRQREGVGEHSIYLTILSQKNCLATVLFEKQRRVSKSQSILSSKAQRRKDECTESRMKTAIPLPWYVTP